MNNFHPLKLGVAVTRHNFKWVIILVLFGDKELSMSQILFLLDLKFLALVKN